MFDRGYSAAQMATPQVCDLGNQSGALKQQCWLKGGSKMCVHASISNEVNGASSAQHCYGPLTWRNEFSGFQNQQCQANGQQSARQ